MVTRIYHGTSGDRKDIILRDGIVPRVDAQSNWSDAPSNCDMVYMSVAYPLYFAGCVDGDHDHLVLFEIDMAHLHQDRCYPDEDFILQAQCALPGHDTQQDIAKNLEDYKDLYAVSVEYLGNMAYSGVIAPTAFTRCVEIDITQRAEILYEALQPTITIENFRFLGKHYQQLVAWLFGDVPLLPQVVDSQQFVRQFYKKEGEAVSPGMDKLRVEAYQRLEYWKAQSKVRTGITVTEL